jgi:membrane fusion protein (multidrug efflux system)
LLGATLVSAANAESDNGANTKDEKGDPPSAQQSPPPGVVVAAVQTQDVAAERRYIGTIKAIQSVDLRARVEGFLDEVAFKQGYTVEAGQLLYQIEQDQYQAALASAEGQLAASHAQLASAKATLEDKQADFERFAALVKKGDTSQTNFDRAKAQRDEASASVETAQASIKQAQAAIEQAKINLGYTSIVSPIAGRIGATKYTEGNLVDPSSGTLATVMQLDPIRAVFSIPSSDFVRLQERLADDGADHARDLFVPHLILPTGTYYKEKGQVAFADNQVNPQTGTIPIYADFPNPDRLLLPGQFVTAVVRSAETRKAPVVPASAIQRTREGERVYLVGPDNRVEQRKIETGVQIDSGYAVTSGLQSGEIVIVSGVQKVKPGMVVNPIKQSASGTRSAGVSSTSSDSKTDSGGEAGTAASDGSSSDSKADGSDGASSGSATTDVRQDAGQSNGSAGSGNASASSTASGSGEATDASPDAGSGSSANASTTRNDTNDSQ